MAASFRAFIKKYRFCYLLDRQRESLQLPSLLTSFPSIGGGIICDNQNNHDEVLVILAGEIGEQAAATAVIKEEDAVSQLSEKLKAYKAQNLMFLLQGDLFGHKNIQTLSDAMQEIKGGGWLVLGRFRQESIFVVDREEAINFLLDEIATSHERKFGTLIV